MLDEYVKVVVGNFCICLQIVQCLKVRNLEAADVAVVD